MDETLDIRCKRLADYLNCDPKIVQRYYLSTGASVAIDSSQNDELKADLEKLRIAKRYVEKALDKLNKLSKLEKATQLLGGSPINVTAANLYANLQNVILSNENLREENTALGGRNTKAHLIAKMVECVFDEVGWEISFGGPTNDKEPRTKFTKAVHAAIRIFEVKSRQKPNTNQIDHKDADYADWQSPSKAIYQSRLSLGQKIS